jgi:DNA-binding GntR family transcriptional regulator
MLQFIASLRTMARSFDGERVEIVSAVSQAADLLRRMIADGRLTQGERLPEIPLSEAFGVSRNTVRDAIRILISEGLVLHEANRGAVVRTLSIEDIRDIYAIRRRLELEAITAVPVAPAEFHKCVHAEMDACDEALESGDYSAFVEHELNIHFAIVAHLRSERTNRFFGVILAELRLIFGILADDDATGATRGLMQMYRSVYRAAENGDPTRGQEILKAHLDLYEERLVTALNNDSSTHSSSPDVLSDAAQRRGLS